MALHPGARVGPYEIDSPVGAGGIGVVYRARDTRLDRIVAIEVFPEAVASDPQFRDRFDRARASSRRSAIRISARCSMSVTRTAMPSWSWNISTVRRLPSVSRTARLSHVVYVASVTPSSPTTQLMVRALDRLEVEPLRDTTNARGPFFSPDGRWLGFVAGIQELKKISITGGPAIRRVRCAEPALRGIPSIRATRTNSGIFVTEDTSRLRGGPAAGDGVRGRR